VTHRFIGDRNRRCNDASAASLNSVPMRNTFHPSPCAADFKIVRALES
jgi:hypothetical protein